MKKIIILLTSIFSLSFTVKTIVKVSPLILLVNEVKSQGFAPSVNSDGSYTIWEIMSPSNTYGNRIDILKITNDSIRFRNPIVMFDSLKLKEHGNPTGKMMWMDGTNGVLKVSSMSTIQFPYSQLTGTPVISSAVTQTIMGTNGISITSGVNTYTISKTKRQETYTGTTNSSGIVTFTFAAFSSTPNIQYNPGFGFGNKETCIPNAASTITSCSFYVQLRADVLGLLPSYSNVVGREVNIVLTEK